MHVVANFRLPPLHEDWARLLSYDVNCREFSYVETFLKFVRHETHDTKQVSYHGRGTLTKSLGRIGFFNDTQWSYI